MDLLNKIKLIFSNKQEKKDEPIKEIVQIEELPFKLERKIKEVTTLKERLKTEISTKVSRFEVEINEKIMSLENIDVSQRKEYDRIKIIVEENLNLYISYLKRTIKKIKNVNNEDVEEYINKLFYVLSEFNMTSSMPFEKATILIGDELSDTRKIVRLFIQEISKIVEDNRLIFEKSESCSTLSNLLSESKQLTLLHNEIENKLSETNSALENVWTEQNILKNKLLEIKKGDDFKRNNQEKIDYRNKLGSLESEIQAIRRKLDLKSLLKKFHHDKKIDQLVRDYINDFKNALNEDKELKIVDIFEIDDKKYLSQLKEIQGGLVYLSSLSPTKIDKEIALLEEKIKEKNTHILNLEDSIKNEVKRKDKLLMKSQKISSDIIEKSKLLFK